MQHQDGFFKGTGNLDLYYQRWLPDDQVRAVVVIVHGFSDHCGRYDNLVGVLVRRGMAVYSFDLRGHGQSPGQTGHIDHFSDFRQDTHLFVQFAAGQNGHLPIYIFGHSMGGLIALDQTLHFADDFDGVIASAPLLGSTPLSPIKVALGSVLSRVWPTFSMNAGLDVTAISRNETVVQAYMDDPLVHGRGSARLSTELDAAIIETQANAHLLGIPLLMYYGTEDRLTNPKYGRHFYDNAGSTYKRFVMYEGGHHENHNDIHYERVAIEVSQWIEAQILISSQQQEPQDSIDG